MKPPADKHGPCPSTHRRRRGRRAVIAALVLAWVWSTSASFGAPPQSAPRTVPAVTHQPTTTTQQPPPAQRAATGQLRIYHLGQLGAASSAAVDLGATSRPRVNYRSARQSVLLPGRPHHGRGAVAPVPPNTVFTLAPRAQRYESLIEVVSPDAAARTGSSSVDRRIDARVTGRIDGRIEALLDGRVDAPVRDSSVVSVSAPAATTAAARRRTPTDPQSVPPPIPGVTPGAEGGATSTLSIKRTVPTRPATKATTPPVSAGSILSKAAKVSG